MDQQSRNQVLTEFKKQTVRVMIATDVAGIDSEDCIYLGYCCINNWNYVPLSALLLRAATARAGLRSEIRLLTP